MGAGGDGGQAREAEDQVRRFHEQLLDPVVIDNFAGGGGASIGIERGMDGRPVDLAVNHDPLAVEMHRANHPFTEHLCEDVFRVDPRKATRGRRPLLAWFSPDCTHFSRAKGAKPVAKKIRGLAWVAVRWARKNPPDVIMIENVREFETWGPLIPKVDDAGRGVVYFERRLGLWLPAMVPDPARLGLTFKRFIGSLRGAGYEVEWRVLNAADYGAPTHRRRLFIIARRDGGAIVWPEATHGPGHRVAGDGGAAAEHPRSPRRHRAGSRFVADAAAGHGEAGREDGRRVGSPEEAEITPWRTAAECIDWTIPCPSIFDRKKPLAEKTQRRIAMGIKRFVLDNPRPFIVRTQHGRDEFRGQSIEQPLGTVTAKHGYGVVSPTLVQTGYSERDGQAPRALDLDKPLGAVVGTGKHAVVSAFLSQFFGGRVGKPATDPVPTVTACDHNALAAVHLTKFRGDSKGSGADAPMPTITSGGATARPAGAAHALAVTSAVLVGVGGPGYAGKPRPVDEPRGTVLAEDHGGLAAVQLTKFYTGATKAGPGTAQAASVDEPLGTVTAQSGRFGLVYSFLTKYFGTGVGQAADEPLHTVTGKHRFGVVTVDIDGVTYAIADIGLRMLTPRELARAQGFPEDYALPVVKSRAVKFIGNSVAPPVVEALVRANVGRASVGRASLGGGKKSKRARLTPSQKAVA